MEKKQYIVPSTEKFVFKTERLLTVGSTFDVDNTQQEVMPTDDPYDDEFQSRGDRRNVWDEEDDLDRSDRGGW